MSSRSGLGTGNFAAGASDYGNSLVPVHDPPYEGFVPDIMTKLANHMGVGFEFRLPSDGWYGARKEDGQWGGMIGDVQKGVSN